MADRFVKLRFEPVHQGLAGLAETLLGFWCEWRKYRVQNSFTVEVIAGDFRLKQMRVSFSARIAD